LCRQAWSQDLDKAKTLVSDCVEVAERLEKSPVCSEVARIGLHRQVKDLQTLATEVDDDCARKRTELHTEMTQHEHYYECYQVCSSSSGCSSSSTPN